jgi:hypothetical protein
MNRLSYPFPERPRSWAGERSRLLRDDELIQQGLRTTLLAGIRLSTSLAIFCRAAAKNCRMTDSEPEPTFTNDGVRPIKVSCA